MHTVSRTLLVLATVTCLAGQAHATGGSTVQALRILGYEQANGIPTAAQLEDVVDGLKFVAPERRLASLLRAIAPAHKLWATQIVHLVEDAPLRAAERVALAVELVPRLADRQNLELVLDAFLSRPARERIRRATTAAG